MEEKLLAASKKIGFQLTVTNKRLYGKNAWGKPFDIRTDLIDPESAMRIPNGVSVSTYYGIKKFRPLKDPAKIHRAILSLPKNPTLKEESLQNAKKKKERGIKPFIITAFLLGLLIALLLVLAAYTENAHYRDYYRNVYVNHNNGTDCGSQYADGEMCWRCNEYIKENAKREYLDPFYMAWAVAVLCITLLVMLILYLWLGRCQLSVVEGRISGRVAWGRRIQLPVKAIIPGETIRILSGVSVATGNGRIRFPMLKNADEVYHTLHNLESEVDEPEVNKPRVDKPEVNEPRLDEPKADEPKADESELNPSVTQGNYVFVSYARADREQVLPIIQRLEAQGVNCWYDGNIPSGEIWKSIIAGKIEGCSVFMLFVTKSYIQSHYCQKELSYADSQQKVFLPIRMDNTALNPEMRMLLHNWQWYVTKKSDQEMCELASAPCLQCCRNENKL